MALDPKGAAIALHRFGFGPKAGSIAAIASDPKGALLADLDAPGAGQIAAADLMSSGAENRAVYENNAERLAQQKLEQKRKQAAAAGSANPDPGTMMADKPATPPPAADQAQPAPPKPVPLPRQIFLKEARARFDAALNAEVGLVERLVWFWSNHFCVSFDSTVMAGAYEREAIRPHVLGRFADLLLAAESHPAMLLYLDNASSIGPSSVAGINRDRGLNENLAREILELHTLGVRTVYAQADVTNFAKVITGWTILPTVDNPDHGGEFVFNRRMHEPAPQTLIGNTYPDTGVEQGRSVFADLARHPATARHVATKLARHFIADDPPQALIEQLTQRFLDTDGDLKAITTALISAPESWTPEQAKIKRPAEWLVATRRAVGRAGAIDRLTRQQGLMGEPLWQPSAPKGFSDDNATWLDGLALRLEAANAFAQAIGDSLDPQAVADTALGPLATPETRLTMARAESKPQALAFLVMAPEFLRR
ncbi:MAG TPA: DUF1800 family protein [Xanthobacteraceae bacterium]|jgi:uncharacterized protein (DUF1800 family)